MSIISKFSQFTSRLGLKKGSKEATVSKSEPQVPVSTVRQQTPKNIIIKSLYQAKLGLTQTAKNIIDNSKLKQAVKDVLNDSNEVPDPALKKYYSMHDGSHIRCHNLLEPIHITSKDGVTVQVTGLNGLADIDCLRPEGLIDRTADEDTYSDRDIVYTERPIADKSQYNGYLDEAYVALFQEEMAKQGKFTQNPILATLRVRSYKGKVKEMGFDWMEFKRKALDSISQLESQNLPESVVDAYVQHRKNLKRKS